MSYSFPVQLYNFRCKCEELRAAEPMFLGAVLAPCIPYAFICVSVAVNKMCSDFKKIYSLKTPVIPPKREL